MERIPKIVDLSSGNTEHIILTVPITGSNFSVGPTFTAYWTLDFLHFRFVSAGVAADRRIELVLNNGSSTYPISAHPVYQPTGQTLNYYMVPGAPVDFSVTAWFSFIPKPDLKILKSAWSIDSDIFNLTATDQFTLVHAIIRYWAVPG